MPGQWCVPEWGPGGVGRAVVEGVVGVVAGVVGTSSVDVVEPVAPELELELELAALARAAPPPARAAVTTTTATMRVNRPSFKRLTSFLGRRQRSLACVCET
jgi:hypothetical protein